AYAGYLAAAELAGLLQRWTQLAADPQIASELSALITETPISPVAGMTLAPVAPDLLQAEIRAALPKIRDDLLHRKLQIIIQRL
ncbi:MAG: hypothetical protein ABWY00_17660, partial [Dongiaceae bacterium]